MRNNSTEQLHLWVCFHFLLLTPVVFPFPACSSLPFLAFDVFSASNLALSFHISWMFQRNLSNLFPGSDSENITCACHQYFCAISRRGNLTTQLSVWIRCSDENWMCLLSTMIKYADYSSTQRWCTILRLKFSDNFQHRVKTDHPSGPIYVTSCHKTMGYRFTSTNQDIKIIQNFLPLSSCSIRFPHSSVVRFIWVAAMLPFEDMKKLGQRKRDALRCTRYVMVRVLTCASIWEFTWFTLTHDLWRSMASPESREHKRTTEVGCGYQGMLEIRKNHPRSLNSLGRFLKC